MPALTREIPLGDDPSSSDSGNETVTVNSGRATHARANPKGERKRKPFLGDNPFSTEDLPKLEDFVAMDDLPELLMVYDKSNITNRASQGSKREPLLYRRAYPKIPHKSASPRRGCLFLDDANAIASGRRSAVHCAPLVATLGPTTGEGEKRTRVSVAVKTANPDCRSHHLLRQEAKGYATFPREFFTPSKPVPEGAPLRPSPPPAMRPRGTFPGWAAAMRPKSPEPARVDPPIAPRFYGFYVPITPEGKSLVRCHASCKDFANSDCPVPGWAKSLLLMEECGEPIDLLSMPYKHRDECFELVQRMHRQGFSHGHPHPRNMLVQPGPLSVPPALRSMATPSFRLESALGAKRAFEKGREIDVCLAMDELRVGHSDSSDDD